MYEPHVFENQSISYNTYIYISFRLDFSQQRDNHHNYGIIIKLVTLSSSQSKTQKDSKKDFFLKMMRRVYQRGGLISSASSSTIKCMMNRMSKNKVSFARLAIRSCTTESLRQEVRFRRRRFYSERSYTLKPNRLQYCEIKLRHYNIETLLDCSVFVM